MCDFDTVSRQHPLADSVSYSPHNVLVLSRELRWWSLLAIWHRVALTLSILDFVNGASTVTTSNTQGSWIRVCHSIRTTNREVLQCHNLRTDTCRCLIHYLTTGQWVTAVDLSTCVSWNLEVQKKNKSMILQNHMIINTAIQWMRIV